MQANINKNWQAKLETANIWLEGTRLAPDKKYLKFQNRSWEHFTDQ